MNETRHDPVDDVLRSMDAAPATLTTEQRTRADALLEDLLNEPAEPALARLHPPRRRLEQARQWLVPAAAASALGLGALLWPGSPATTSALADWTAEATPVEPRLAETVAAHCRSAMRQPADAVLQVAEQRGSHVFVALRSSTTTAECLAPADTGTVTGGTGSEGPDVSPMTARDAEVSGAGVQSGPWGAYAFTRGRIGSEVAAVIVHAEGQQIRATVANGEYVAWWPTRHVGPGSGPVDVSVDLTYTDGTRSIDHGADPRLSRPGPTELGRVAEGGGVRADGRGGTEQVRFTEGLVGGRVVGVTVHADGVDTVADVRDGRFSARWLAPAADAGGEPTVRYTLTLDDGTVLPDVVPLNR